MKEKLLESRHIIVNVNYLFILSLIPDHPSTPETSKHINCYKKFIDKNRNLFDLEKIDQTRSIPVDILSLTNDCEFISSWSTFSTDLYEHPDTTLRLLEYCLHEVNVFDCIKLYSRRQETLPLKQHHDVLPRLSLRAIQILF